MLIQKMKGNIIEIEFYFKEIELPFCQSTEGKKMRLVRFINKTSEYAVVKIEELGWQYPVLPESVFHCVMCEGKFVQPIPVLFIGEGKYARVRNGKNIYEFNEEDYFQLEKNNYIYDIGLLNLDYEGNIRILGYHFPLGENKESLVYIADGIGVDERGGIMIKERRYYWKKFLEEHRFLQVVSNGYACVDTNRQLYVDAKELLVGEKVVQLQDCLEGFVVLTAQGEVWYGDGENVYKLKEDAIAVSYNKYRIAVADKKGDVFIYYEGESKFWEREAVKLSFGKRHISEIAVSKEMVMILCSDGSLGLFDLETKKSRIDREFFRYSEFKEIEDSIDQNENYK